MPLQMHKIFRTALLFAVISVPLSCFAQLAELNAYLPATLPQWRAVKLSAGQGTGQFIAYQRGAKVMVRSAENGGEQALPLPREHDVLWFHWTRTGAVLHILCQDDQGHAFIYRWDALPKKLSQPFPEEMWQVISFGNPQNNYSHTFQRIADASEKQFWDFDFADGVRVPVRHGQGMISQRDLSTGPKLTTRMHQQDRLWMLDQTIIERTDPQANRMGAGWVGVARGGKFAWLLSAANTDTLALIQVDLQTGSVVHRHDRPTDIRSVVIDPETRHPVAFEWEDHRRHVEVIAPEYAKDWRRIQKALPGELGFVDIAADGKTILVSRYRNELEHFIFNRQTGLLSNVGQPVAHDIVVKGFQAHSVDDLRLNGYITAPKHGTCTTKRCPMVWLLHGGPGARDTLQPHGLRNWLSERGYFVAQINYRGSRGFGKKFENLDQGNWGGKIQRDLEAAHAHLLKHYPKIDPEQVSLMGASFGGDMVLHGLGQTTSFRCGIAEASTADIMQWVRHQRQRGPTDLIKRIGDPDSESGRQSLAQASPLTWAKRVRAPLLLMHGALDPYTPVENFTEYTGIVQRQDALSFVVFTHEGHNILQPDNRYLQSFLIDQFLSKCHQRSPTLPQPPRLRPGAIKVVIDQNRLMEGVTANEN